MSWLRLSSCGVRGEAQVGSGVVVGETGGQLALGVSCESSSLAFCSKVATAANRTGGSSSAANCTIASASLAGASPCLPEPATRATDGNPVLHVCNCNPLQPLQSQPDQLLGQRAKRPG